MENINKKDRILRNRYWLLSNFDWLLAEAIYHRDHSKYFKRDKALLWDYNALEGKAIVFGDINETAGQSQ